MIVDNDSLEAHPSPQKIGSVHLQRLAVVYVRQSTAQQVLQHQESTRLQYGLVDRARQLGWPEERIVVIDDDLGHSAAEGEHRAGFKRLVSEVSLDHVGMILGVEISRLARSSKDWHQLLEICALFGTLIADSDGICDPADFNDRMLCWVSKDHERGGATRHKAAHARGQDQQSPPGRTGLRCPHRLRKKFLRRGDLRSRRRGPTGRGADLQEVRGTPHRSCPTQIPGGPRHPYRRARSWRREQGRARVARPQPEDAAEHAQKPFSPAGAYAYGRRRIDPLKRKPGWRSTGRTSPSPGGWHVLLKDRLPAYTSWQTYEKNLRQLADNRAVAHARGAPRNGNSLLQGLVVCGYCGARMTVNYHGSDKRYSYVCSRRNTVYGGSACQCLSGVPLDGFAAEKVLEALEPAALELSLEAAKNIESERTELDGLWQKRMERATYEAERAGRHYRSVEPENRLVARQLAKDWERKLT